MNYVNATNLRALWDSREDTKITKLTTVTLPNGLK